MKPEPVMTKGAFDSQNLAFWDTTRNRYTCFSRIFSNKIRAVQSNHSPDFLTWSDRCPHRYAEGVPMEHFYTSATVPCPTAPHLFLSFPKRFVRHAQESARAQGAGVSDAVFMSSRDGVNWDRPFLEAWVRPGPDLKNWTDRNNMTANGIIETGDTEWSLYISEHYRHADHRIRRLTRAQAGLRLHACRCQGRRVHHASAQLHRRQAPAQLRHLRRRLRADRGAGRNRQAHPASPSPTCPNFTATNSRPRHLEVRRQPRALKGQTIRLRVKLKDADLYALRFAD